MINAPSLANCNCLEFGDNVRELVKGGVTFFHIDLMDGHYVPNLCLPPNYISDLKKTYPQVTAEVHMMVSDPIAYIPVLKKNGADYVAFHADATSFVHRTLHQIHEAGMKAGVVINPSQRIDQIEPYIEYLDYVVLMTVEPGFAAQRFLPGSLDRIKGLAELRKRHKANFLLEIDGGVDYENARACVECGADILVTGIYIIFKQPDGIAAACKRFEEYMADAAPLC